MEEYDNESGEALRKIAQKSHPKVVYKSSKNDEQLSLGGGGAWRTLGRMSKSELHKNNKKSLKCKYSLKYSFLLLF